MLKHVFNIIRWPNLLMLGGIQLLVYFRLLDPAASILSLPDLSLIITITILSGAGGYVINDYYDYARDSINKPKRWIAGNKWPLKTVKHLYLIIIFLGFCLSVWSGVRLGLMRYLFIYPAAVAGLWLYSFAFKCMPIIGNIWVALFCAGVVGVVALPDILFENSHHIKIELWYYMAFAFLATWLREVIKDIEDLDGDAQTKCRTAVVRFGLKSGKIMVIILGILLVGSLLLWDNQQTNHWIRLTLTVLQGFTVGAMAFVGWAKNNNYYHHASTIIKWVMIGGTLILLYP